MTGAITPACPRNGLRSDRQLQRCHPVSPPRPRSTRGNPPANFFQFKHPGFPVVVVVSRPSRRGAGQTTLERPESRNRIALKPGDQVRIAPFTFVFRVDITPSSTETEVSTTLQSRVAR